MISVIVYGRNDTHGYNLHRRVALSLNCLAEVLTDPDDEIVYVDYNTPDELPTLVDALADTLTPRCLDTLRVLRVPASIHEERFASRTHLPAIEPVARNVAARRSNPANRWLLSTNTDMVLLPRSDRSLTDICRDLPDGFYGLPRFELPEWLWEQLPRSDPRRALTEIARVGDDLRLDERTVSHEWIRFDAPGDFQLMLREDLFAIDGFDEQMLLGWHVDSNISRRLFLRLGSIETLEDDVAAYHCNHSRTPTVYHGEDRVANDLEEFFFRVERAELPEQRAEWGLADLTLPSTGAHRGAEVANAAAAAVATATAPVSRLPSDARTVKYSLSYDSGHVLAFVADSLAVSRNDSVIGYVGANPVLERMLLELVEELALETPLTALDLDDPDATTAFLKTADVVVVDLGIDQSLLQAAPVDSSDGVPAESRVRLELAFEALQHLVELERARLEQGAHPHRFVLVNSSAAFWNAYVLAQLQCSSTTPHSRVRRATVKAAPDTSGTTEAALQRAAQLLRFAGRPVDGNARLRLRAGKPVAIAGQLDFGGFGQGWAYPDRTAIWTQGPRSHVAIEVDGTIGSGDSLGLAIGKVGVRPGESFRVAAIVNGTRAAIRDFNRNDPDLTWDIPIGGLTPAARTIDLTLVLREPATWLADQRRLGLHVRSMTYRTNSRRERLRAVYEGYGAVSRRKLANLRGLLAARPSRSRSGL